MSTGTVPPFRERALVRGRPANSAQCHPRSPRSLRKAMHQNDERLQCGVGRFEPNRQAGRHGHRSSRRSPPGRSGGVARDDIAQSLQVAPNQGARSRTGNVPVDMSMPSCTGGRCPLGDKPTGVASADPQIGNHLPLMRRARGDTLSEIKSDILSSPVSNKKCSGPPEFRIFMNPANTLATPPLCLRLALIFSRTRQRLAHMFSSGASTFTASLCL